MYTVNLGIFDWANFEDKEENGEVSNKSRLIKTMEVFWTSSLNPRKLRSYSGMGNGRIYSIFLVSSSSDASFSSYSHKLLCELVHSWDEIQLIHLQISQYISGNLTNLTLPLILTQAVCVPVGRRSGGQLAMTLVATINIIIFSFFFSFLFSFLLRRLLFS